MQLLISSPYTVAAFLVIVLMVCHEAGYQIGRRLSAVDDDYRQRVSMIRNATLALVTFLIGFSFAAAGTRFIDRQDLMVKEANAIGTSWLRAGLLAEPQRTTLQAELRQYAADRVEILSTQDTATILRLVDKAGQRHQQIWQAGVAGVGSDRVLATLVLPPLNDVIDIHSEHLSTARRRIPMPIVLAIIVAAAVGLGMIGYDNGLVRKRYFLLSGAFAAVSAASLWMAIDLDRPREGFLRVSAEPYVELLESMK